MRSRTIKNTKRAAVLAALTAAACMTPGSANSQSISGMSAHENATQTADRTLVPRRIRLIIDYKRPRLA